MHDTRNTGDTSDNGALFRRLSQIAREARAVGNDTEWLARIVAERDEIRRTLAASGLVRIIPHADTGAVLTYSGARFLCEVHGLGVGSLRATPTKAEP